MFAQCNFNTIIIKKIKESGEMTHMNSSYTVIVFCHFEGLFPKFIAFISMVFLPFFSKNSGYKFFKLFGTGGGNGFNIKPDFSRYSYLCIWSSEDSFLNAVHENTYFKIYHYFAKSIEVFQLQAFRVHGTWNQKQPFEIIESGPNGKHVAVITRATIKWKSILYFHKHVPDVSRHVSFTPGHLLSTGIGEWPFRFQATFSLWESSDYMENYAYRSKEHREIIAKTKKINWYKEEMFARFYVVKNWNLKV
jgi:hypothetical protein